MFFFFFLYIIFFTFGPTLSKVTIQFLQRTYIYIRKTNLFSIHICMWKKKMVKIGPNMICNTTTWHRITLQNQHDDLKYVVSFLFPRGNFAFKMSFLVKILELHYLITSYYVDIDKLKWAFVAILCTHYSIMFCYGGSFKYFNFCIS